MFNVQALAEFKLARGAHKEPEDGLCFMEAVAWLEGEPHSDQPTCVCPVIGAYIRSLNDFLPDDLRQKLIPYLPRVVGTVSLGSDVQRGQILAWKAITQFVPIILTVAGLLDHAKNLSLLKLYDWDSAVTAARAAADAARAADAAYAANATAYAANAAHTANAATNASNAVHRAADAAHAAAYVSDVAASIQVWNLAIGAIDEVLAVGKPSQGFTCPVPRIEAYRHLIGASPREMAEVL